MTKQLAATQEAPTSVTPDTDLAPGVSPNALPKGLFELMIGVSAEGMLAVDDGGRILFANAAAADLLGRDVDALIGAEFGLPMAAEEPVDVELLHPKRGAPGAELRVAMSPEGIHVVMLRDVSQWMRLRNELQRLALVDSLTGVANRRAFLALGEQALRLAGREDRPCLLVFVDIDQMKAINDRYGHRTGDNAVIKTATMLTDTVRDSDIVARIGGDEFCVLLTGTSGRPDSLDDAMDRIRQAADQLSGSAEFPLSVTFGAARFDHEGNQTIHDLMDAADAEMYAAKRRKQRRMRMLFMGESQARDAVRQAIEQAGSDDVPLIDVDTIEDILRVTKTEDRDVLVVQEGVTDVSTLMATLRGLSATNMLPVLSIQIESDPVAEERALNLGVNDVVDRGMPPAVILARIRRTLDTPAR